MSNGQTLSSGFNTALPEIISSPVIGEETQTQTQTQAQPQQYTGFNTALPEIVSPTAVDTVFTGAVALEEEEEVLEVLGVNEEPKQEGDTLEDHALKAEVKKVTTYENMPNPYEPLFEVDVVGEKRTEPKEISELKFFERFGTFDPEGKDFDEKSAILGDARDNSGEYGSIDRKNGMVLKGKNHPEWKEMEDSEAELGNTIVLKNDGRYYSVPKSRGLAGLTMPPMESTKQSTLQNAKYSTSYESALTQPEFTTKPLSSELAVKPSIEEVVEFREKIDINNSPLHSFGKEILTNGQYAYLEAPEGVEPEAIAIDYLTAKNQYLSQETKLEGWNKFVSDVHTYVAPTVSSAIPGYRAEMSKGPDEESIVAVVANIITGSGELVAGMAEMATAFGDFVFKAEGDRGLEVVGMVGSMLQMFATEPGRLLEATGWSPVPGRNIFSEEGKAVVAKARQHVYRNPVLPVVTALGLLKAPKTYWSARNSAIQHLNTAELAIQYLKAGEAATGIKVTPEVIALAESIKKAPKKAQNRLESEIIQAKQLELNFQESTQPKTKTKKKKKPKKGKSEDKLNNPLEANLSKPSKGAINKHKKENKAFTQKKMEKQLKDEMADLVQTKRATEARLKGEEPLTEMQRASLESTLDKANNLIEGNAKKMADMGINPIEYFEMSFGLTKAQARWVWNKILKGGDLSVSVFRDRLQSGLISPEVWNKKNPFFSEEVMALQDRFNWQDTKLKRLLGGNDGGLWDSFMRNWVDPNWDISKAIHKSDSPRHLVDEVMTKLGINRGSQALTEAQVNWAKSKINEGMSKKDTQILNRILQGRRQGQINTRNETKIPEWTAELKTTRNKKRQTELKKKIEEAENYTHALSYKIDPKTGRRVKDTDGNFIELERGEVIKAYRQYVEGMKLERPDLYNKATEVFDLYKENLKELYEADIYAPELFGELNMYEYQKTQYLERYEPLMGQHFGTNGKLSVRDNNLKSLKSGSGEAIMNDWATLYTDAVRIKNDMIFQQKANQALAEFIKGTPNNGFSYLPKPNAKIKPGYSTVSYLVEGKPQTIALKNDLAKSWVRSDPIITQNLANWSGWISGTKALKGFATGHNPAFALVNLPRDIAYVYLTTNQYSSFIPIAGAQMVRDYASVAKDMVTRNRRPNPNKPNLYHDYIRNGGGLPGLAVQGRLGSISSPYATKSKAGQIYHERLHPGMEALKDKTAWIGESSEVWTRLALMKRGMRNGLTKEQATWVAREYMDFGTGGAYAKAIDTAIPYFNASIQATRGLFRAAHREPGAFGFKVAQVALLESMNWMHNNYLYDDNRQYISPQMRFNNHIFMTGGVEVDKNNQKRQTYITIPKDSGQKIIGGLVNAMMEYQFGDGVTGNQIFDLVKNSLYDLTPADISRVPPLFNIIAGTMQNKDLRSGYQIFTGDHQVTAKERRNFKERDLVADFSKSWNQKFVGDIVPMNPSAMNHALKQYALEGNYFWGLGNNLYDKHKESTIGFLEREDNTVPWSDNPVFKPVSKRFIRRTGTKNYAEAELIRNREVDYESFRQSNNNLLTIAHKKREVNKAGGNKDIADLVMGQGDGDERMRLMRRSMDMSTKGHLTIASDFVRDNGNEKPIVKAWATMARLHLLEDAQAKSDFIGELITAKFFTANTVKHLLRQYTIKDNVEWWVNAYGQESYDSLVKDLKRIKTIAK